MDELKQLIILNTLLPTKSISHGGVVVAPPPHGEERVEEPMEDPRTHLRILTLLETHGCTFRTLVHAPTKTSEESAQVRGVELASGAKAMLLKCSKDLPHGTPYLLAVLSASRKADLKLLRASLGQKSVSLASVEDVARLTGCVPGAVPPFGSLFPGVRTYVDPSIVERTHINFNAGLRGFSVCDLPVSEYLRVESPQVLAFTTSI
jgi:Ala-tRNA(Pro) deacylase